MADARNATAWLPSSRQFLPSQTGSSHPPVAYRVARVGTSAGGVAYQKAYDRLRQDNANAERELLRKMRHHLVQSIFERCVTDLPEGLRGQLIEQRRMIDPIAALVRDPVYGGRYLTPPPEQLGVQPLTTSRTFTQPVVFLDTSGYPGAGETQEGTGCFNTGDLLAVGGQDGGWLRDLEQFSGVSDKRVVLHPALPGSQNSRQSRIT